jgi:1-acyl-sn-glycerol-3-phosphate acyltransferase
MNVLRSTVFNIWFYGTTAALALAGLVPGWLSKLATPAWALDFAKIWARLVIGGLRVICGTRWQVTGLEHLPKDGPALIVSMHQSAFDTMVWFLLVPRACYVLKRELLALPVFGPMCRLTGMIAVDRDAGAAAIRALLKQADRAVAERRQIVIFPEGTRVAAGRRAELQPGIAALASRTRLPVIPVTTDSGLCWGRRAFRKRPGVIHMVIGAPIPAGLPRAQLMAQLEALFGAAADAIAAGTTATG